MAVTSLDAVVAGLLPSSDFMKVAVTAKAAGTYHNSMYLAGLPGATAVYAGGANGVALTSLAGQIPFPAAVGGKNTHLAVFEGSHAGNVGTLILCDRLWHNSLTVTTLGAQAITFPGLPARDANGSANGVGVMVGLEIAASTTNAGTISNTVLTYTNAAGGTGITSTLPTVPATPSTGSFFPFPLGAGETGIRAATSISLGTSYVTGSINLVAYRQIASIGVPLANVSAAKDFIALGGPRMYDNSVPFIIYVPSATAVGVVDAQITYTQN